MKKTRIISIVCIMLVALCCFVACGENDAFNAKSAKSISITATLTHADGVLLQKIESTFTKDGKTYNHTTKNTSLSPLDSNNNEMYTTDVKEESNAKLPIQNWVNEDFAAIFQKSETRISGKITAAKISALGIADADGDVIATLELDGKSIVSLTITYTNAKNGAVSIVATMSY